MAKTRAQIKTAVHLNTGRGTEKASLIESACDEALKVALESHAFKDSLSFDQDTVIVEDALSVDISAITNLLDVVSATVVETSGVQNKIFCLQNEAWWNLHVVNAEDNEKGWPSNGIRRGTLIYLERPSDSGLSLRLTVSKTQTFSSDSTECPIALLDTFVTQYATAMVFMAIENYDKATAWLNLALGPQYYVENKIGGSLLSAINKDKKDIAQMFKATAAGAPAVAASGVAVKNLIVGHPNYGNVELWSRP